MGDEIRAGVIGSGWPSLQHINGYRKCKNVEVVSICDLNRLRLNEVAREYGIKGRYESFEEMLERERLDVLSICTPNFLHAPMAISAMKKGVHVLCEKPMASTVNEAQMMLEVQRVSGMILMIAHQRRFSAEARYLKEMISRGEFGRIYYCKAWWVRRSGIPGIGGWFTDKTKSGGGALLDIGVHVLDLALWLLDFPDPLDVISSYGSRFGINGRGAGNYVAALVENKSGFNVDDYAFAHINFAGGCSLQLQCSWAGHIKEDDVNIEIWGEKCGARLYPLEIFTERNGVPVDISPKLKQMDPYEEEVRVFIEAVERKADVQSSAEEGVKTIRLIDKIYESGAGRYGAGEGSELYQDSFVVEK